MHKFVKSENTSTSSVNVKFEILSISIFSPENCYIFQNQYCFDPLSNKNVKFFNEVFIPFLNSVGIEYGHEVLDDKWQKGYPESVKWRVYITNLNDVNLILINFPNAFKHEGRYYSLKRDD